MLDRDQIEAYAAQGYNTIEIGRLLGEEVVGREPMIAYTDGQQRWRAAGTPDPRPIREVIAERIMAAIRRKEMSKADLISFMGIRIAETMGAIEMLLAARYIWLDGDML